MYYNVAQLLKEPVGSTRTYKIAGAVPTDSGVATISPEGQLQLMRTDKGIWLNARLTARQWVTCGRCLREFHHPVEFAINEEYLPTVDIHTGQSMRVLEGQEGVFAIDRRHILDVREALRQYILTNQPMKPLCREDCRGLCPVCGTDRSQLSCSCHEEPSDPRRGALQTLLEEGGR